MSGINCNPRTAKIEMQKIKKFYGKEDGVIAYHGYQSFAPGEATPEIAHEIGVKLAQRLWGDRYPASVKRVPYSMRQDLILLDKLDAETRFLAKHEYGSLVELESHRAKSTGRIAELEQERNALRSQLRTATRREDAPAVENLKSRIKEVSSEIKTLRQEVKLCDEIEARSALMERNLEQLQQEQEIERKEEEQHELFRRGGRSGRPSELERG